MPRNRARAFVAKTLAKKPGNPSESLRVRSTSYNGDYAAFAWALSDAKVVARFWSYVCRTKPDACWLWQGNCVGRGSKNRPEQGKHGQFTYTYHKKQYHVFAHRFAYALKHGPIPSGVLICHTCDCPPCCNERHFFAGSVADNMADAARKGRLTVPRTRTLSLYDRLRIYREPTYPGVCVNFAREYGVTKACISLIRSGRFLGSGRWSGTKVVA